jgi:hypothetical protein
MSTFVERFVACKQVRNTLQYIFWTMTSPGLSSKLVHIKGRI